MICFRCGPGGTPKPQKCNPPHPCREHYIDPRVPPVLVRPINLKMCATDVVALVRVAL